MSVRKTRGKGTSTAGQLEGWKSLLSNGGEDVFMDSGVFACVQQGIVKCCYPLHVKEYGKSGCQSQPHLQSLLARGNILDNMK